MTKRGSASVKSMAKVYKSESLLSTTELIGETIGCKGAVIAGINTIALLMRMELYVDEHRWKSLQDEKQTQTALNALISACEDQIVPTLIHWNKVRTKVIGGEYVQNETIYKVKLQKLDKVEKRVESNWNPL